MTQFNKRHYESIALAMQAAYPIAHAWVKKNEQATQYHQWTLTCEALADTFQADNGMFKRDRFIAACEPGANVKLRARYKVAS